MTINKPIQYTRTCSHSPVEFACGAGQTIIFTGVPTFSGKNDPPRPIFRKFWSLGPIFSLDQNFVTSPLPSLAWNVILNGFAVKDPSHPVYTVYAYYRYLYYFLYFNFLATTIMNNYTYIYIYIYIYIHSNYLTFYNVGVTIYSLVPKPHEKVPGNEAKPFTFKN